MSFTNDGIRNIGYKKDYQHTSLRLKEYNNVYKDHSIK